MPFTWVDILLILGLAAAATFFIFVFVNPPEALVLWMTGKSKPKTKDPVAVINPTSTKEPGAAIEGKTQD
jgi:hypothetical protein